MATPITSIELAERPWTSARAVCAALLVAAGVVAQREAFAGMILTGLHRPEQSHLLLALPIALWLAWVRRSRVRQLRWAPSLWGPALVVAALVLSRVGRAWDAPTLGHASALLTVTGALVATVGLAPLRLFGPAFAILVAMIPFPDALRHALLLPLQELATGVTHVVLELAGVPLAREGAVLVINGESVAVGEACNGMRLILALVLVVYTFVFSTPLRPGVRAILIAASPFVALLSNVVRLVPTAFVFGYGTSAQANAFHHLSGWLMLPAAFLLMLAIVRILRWTETPINAFRLALR